MSNAVLCISVHPDDETLACGGAILKHRENGDEVYWLILTDVYERDGWSSGFVQARHEEIRDISEIYGFVRTVELGLSTMMLDTIPRNEIIKKISGIISDVKPQILFCPNRTDIHSDHRVAFDCIMSATKSFNHQNLKRVLMYECISETEFAPPLPENSFQPNCFIDISKYLEEKIRIMKIYSTEMKSHPFPRSEKNIRALATFRGAQCGVEYAEGFMILKDIWK